MENAGSLICGAASGRGDIERRTRRFGLSLLTEELAEIDGAIGCSLGLNTTTAVMTATTLADSETARTSLEGDDDGGEATAAARCACRRPSAPSGRDRNGRSPSIREYPPQFSGTSRTLLLVSSISLCLEIIR